MPALTVDDITVLPRIPEPDPTVARQRPIKSRDRGATRPGRGGLPGPTGVRRG